MSDENERKIKVKTLTIDGEEYVRRADTATPESTKQIVILQRGWVMVGDLSRDTENTDGYVLRNASVIRAWGTSKGLGELVDGPLASTKLDYAGTVRFHELTVVARLDADAEGWSK